MASVEEWIDSNFAKLTSNSMFLSAVSLVLNANSYRKIATRRVIENIWKDLELPARRDHESMKAVVLELQIRIRRLEMELEKERMAAEKEVTKKVFLKRTKDAANSAQII